MAMAVFTRSILSIFSEKTSRNRSVYRSIVAKIGITELKSLRSCFNALLNFNVLRIPMFFSILLVVISFDSIFLCIPFI